MANYCKLPSCSLMELGGSRMEKAELELFPQQILCGAMPSADEGVKPHNASAISTPGPSAQNNG